MHNCYPPAQTLSNLQLSKFSRNVSTRNVLEIRITLQMTSNSMTLWHSTLKRMRPFMTFHVPMVTNVLVIELDHANRLNPVIARNAAHEYRLTATSFSPFIISQMPRWYTLNKFPGNNGNYVNQSQGVWLTAWIKVKNEKKLPPEALIRPKVRVAH